VKKITNFKLQISNKKECGQSLVEIIVAVGLIFTAVVALLGLATLSMKGSGFGLRKAQATKLANEEMEFLRAYRDDHGWGTLCSTVEGDCEGSNCYATPGNITVGDVDDSNSPFIRYFRARNVNCSGDPNQPDVLRLDVYVEWSAHGEDKTVKISSELSNWH